MSLPQSLARLGFIWDERASMLRASRLDFLSGVVSRSHKETKAKYASVSLAFYPRVAYTSAKGLNGGQRT